MADNFERIIDHVVGHKGAGFSVPENTLQAFNEASRMGLTMTEFDVRLTKDGVAVLSNQDNLKNTSTIDKVISQSNYADLHDLDVGAYHNASEGRIAIPLLDEALPLIKSLGLRPQIELKSHSSNWQDLAQTCAQIIDTHYADAKPEHAPLVTSFDPDCLALFNQHTEARYETGLLIHSEKTQDWQATAAGHDFDYIHIFSGHIDAQIAQGVRDAGYGLNAYKVMDHGTAQKILGLGVGRFTTDEPEIFVPEA